MNATQWFLVALSIILTLGLALHEQRELASALKSKTLSKRKQARFKLWLAWPSFAVASLLALVSQKSAHDSDQIIAKLQAQLRPRTITSTQRTDIVETLKPFNQDKICVTWSPVRGFEAQNYANEIADTLIAAGFSQTICREESISFPLGEQGVQISYASTPGAIENIRRIRAAFDGIVFAEYTKCDVAAFEDASAIHICAIQKAVP
jgi:hypothetical protein